MRGLERPNWAPGDIDLERPSVARVYDYWLGGAHNFAADRAVGQKALQNMPELRNVILTNRAFLRRAVRHLVSAGVRQFLDLGSGIPTAGNVHEIARTMAPEARVAYVDIDPVAVAHSRSILEDDPRLTVLQADIRDTASVLKSPEVSEVLDFDEPIAVLMIALLHFVPDSDEPGKIIAGYRDGLPENSYLAISHAGFEQGEEQPGERQARQLYNRQVTPMTYRNLTELTALFDGCALVEPGVVRLPMWRPDSPDDIDGNAAHFPAFGAVGKKL